MIDAKISVLSCISSILVQQVSNGATDSIHGARIPGCAVNLFRGGDEGIDLLMSYSWALVNKLGESRWILSCPKEKAVKKGMNSFSVFWRRDSDSSTVSPRSPPRFVRWNCKIGGLGHEIKAQLKRHLLVAPGHRVNGLQTLAAACSCARKPRQKDCPKAALRPVPTPVFFRVVC